MLRNLYGAHPERYAKWGLSGHEGLDYAGYAGKPIRAIADGTVKLLARDNGVHPYGNHIRITHADGFESIYAHLRGFITDLVAGSVVRQGQQIGFMGDTGNADGVHLHLTLKRNGQIIDPTPYLRGQ